MSEQTQAPTHLAAHFRSEYAVGSPDRGGKDE